MAQPVWVLSVDLQTKTATFQSGMADAAKSARGAFKDIQQGSGEMGRDVGYSMGEARHSVMILGEEFGVHLPRSLTSFVAGLGPVGPALEAAFPFLAIVLGASLFIEHLRKTHEEAEKAVRSQEQFETATNNAFNALDQKILQAEIRADELNKDHLGALKHELELIDKQSLEELAHSFDVVAKAADASFAQIKAGWEETLLGTAGGAKNALDNFKAQYESLLARGKDKEAHDLLAGTLHSAERVLDAQKQYAAMADQSKKHQPFTMSYNEAAQTLSNAGVGAKDDDIRKQQILIDALNAQVKVEEKIAVLKKTQSDNAKHATNDTVTGEASRIAIDQLKADNAAEEQAEREREEARQRAIARLENGERQKIAATRQGSQERLQAIDAAIHEEEKYGLQETAFYQSLLVQRVETTRQMVEEEARIRAEAGREAAAHAQKMGELEIAAEREAAKLRNSSRRVTQQELRDQDIHFADEEYALQLAAINKQITALDKNDKDYDNKLRALYDRQEELEREHQNKITEIKDRATIERNAKILAEEQRAQQAMVTGLTSVLMHHQSFASMMAHIGDQVATGLMESAIKYALTLDANKRHEAAAAARQGWLAGQKFPFPINIAMAPVLAASAFEAVMGFAEGGIVPGVGRGDTVPAMLTPGEHVADQELTNGLRNMVRNGGAVPRHSIQIHYRPTYHVQTIDGDGIRGVLREHADEFNVHVESTVRRMNQ